MQNSLIAAAASLFAGSLAASSLVGQASTTGQWNVQQHESQASLRGLCVVDNRIAWASGSANIVLRSSDGGQSWQSVGPNLKIELDFRDIHAFDEARAVIISAGTPARIYRTSDGGATWNKVFEANQPEAFFDAMAFWDERHGIAFSDPVGGRLLVVVTDDGGKSWNELPDDQRPATLPGEAGFAASGTCLAVQGRTKVWIGLGGATDQEPSTARVLYSSDRGRSWEVQDTEIISSETSGIFSLAFAHTSHGVAVGGTYDQPDDDTSNIAITDDGGRTWQRPTGDTPGGYRSCVAIRLANDTVTWFAVGRNGCDISTDHGESWSWLSDEPFHAVAFSGDGQTGIAVGTNGRIGQWKD